MPYRLLLITLLLEAARTQITGFGDTALDYGKDAHYKCELQNQKGVQQITWQKRLRDYSVENVASYSTIYGQNINDPYQRKVILSETSLNSTSLTIKNVTWEDENCYICIFNIFPGESKRKETCLTLRGISEVKTKVHYSELANGSALFVLSCSATGKPEPTIRWHFSPNIDSFDQLPITTLANADRTFTSSRNVTLHISGSWKGHAYCVAQSGNQKEQTTPVNLSRHAGIETWKESEETERRQSEIFPLWLCVAVVALLPVVVAVVSSVHQRGKEKRDSVCPSAFHITPIIHHNNNNNWISHHFISFVPPYRRKDSTKMLFRCYFGGIRVRNLFKHPFFNVRHILLQQFDMFGFPLSLTLLLWFGGTSTTRASVHQDGNKVAVRGEPATLSCWYSLPERVLQVLWKKKAEWGGSITVASYSQSHYNVDAGLESRLSLSKSLGDTRLSFHAVTVQDDTCYICEFHTFPDGRRSGTACLSVYVLPEVKVAHVTLSSGVTEANCSSQSRPAAEITWRIGANNQSLNTSLVTRYSESERITTVTNTLLLPPGLFSAETVQCVVHHQGLENPLFVSLNGPLGEILRAFLRVVCLMVWSNSFVYFKSEFDLFTYVHPCGV
ncbi:uncharacterized protein LOC144205809 [Stigmatopora nigra]